ncbi:MAG: MaoC family dehydratase [Pseudomonadota bacterium]
MHDAQGLNPSGEAPSRPVFASAQALVAAAGHPLGCSDWLRITQERIDQFAAATGDHQWIHVDPQRAAAGPYGATIAHGYLTLSLANLFMPQILQVDMRMGLNYGSDRVRFPAPVRVGSRLRGSGKMLTVTPLGDGGVQCVIQVTVELEGSERPACVVDSLNRYYF